MRKLRAQNWLLSLVIVLTAAVWLAIPLQALAEVTPPPAPAQVSLDTKYPVLSGESGDSFNFDVDMSYTGTDKQKFAVSVTPPVDWTATATTSTGKRAAVIELGPADSFPASEFLSVRLSPPQNRTRDYKVMDRPSIKQSIHLTAR